MRVLISGASGFVGSAVTRHLKAAGQTVCRLVRSGASGTERILWDPAGGQIDAGPLEGFEAVVHLAGENIAVRWSEPARQRIYDSRVTATQLLCRTLAGLAQPPLRLLCASAVGYYGDRGDEWLDESSPPGSGFLADLCQEWENATVPASEAGIAVANLRLGIVLSPSGGPLQRMLAPFRLGVGGPLGSGRQYVSWISRSDAARAVEYLLPAGQVCGPVNLVAPAQVTNRELATALGRVLRRPARLAAPAFALRILLGGMADGALLASQRVRPQRLLEAGFAFEDPSLEPALRRMLNANATRS